jgi:hypothetical protein
MTSTVEERKVCGIFHGWGEPPEMLLIQHCAPAIE